MTAGARPQQQKIWRGIMKATNFLAIAAAATVLAVPAQAITWGEPDGGTNPHVGTLLFVQNGVGFFSCTGTLIAPRVLLTAGHCVAARDANGVMQPNNLTFVRFEDNALEGIQNYQGNLGGWLANDWLAVEQVIPHPQWSDYSQFPITYDIGVVILAEPYDAGVTGTLPTAGFLETLKGTDRQYFRVAGYGVQGTLPPTAQEDYEKYKGTVRLIELNSKLSGSGMSSVKFSNNPGIGGGTCYGDSGGPVFYKDTQTVVAVTSFGWAKNGNCIGNSFFYRTDIPASQDFLEEVLEEYGD
jgi:hypothetical protein